MIRKHYWSLERVPEEAKALAQIWQLFQSEPFFLLLANLTGLRLHPLAPEDRSDRIGYEFRGRQFYLSCVCRSSVPVLVRYLPCKTH